MVTMHEGDHLLIMGMRLRVELGRITEIETKYYRQGGGGPNGIAALDASTPDPIFTATVPEADRVSRAQMISTANMYFAGLENNDGKAVYPFADDCNRVENGMQTTNNPTLSPNAAFNAFGMSCMAQFKSGYYAIVTRIDHRRFPIVDQERGVVWANVIFDQNGTVQTIHLTNGQTVSMKNFQPPVEPRGHRGVQDHRRPDPSHRYGRIGLAVSSRFAVGRHHRQIMQRRSPRRPRQLLVFGGSVGLQPREKR